jgi:hypothetical protein
MASVIMECTLNCPAEPAWALLADVANPHRAFPGVLTDARSENDERIVTFADGMVVRERIVSVDPARRRIAYAVAGGRFTQHSAAMQVFQEAEHCRFLWASDFLPDEFASLVEQLMGQGMAALQSVLADPAVTGAPFADGACACGAVRFSLLSAPMFTHCCHCRDCQRQTGSAFVLNALIETNRIRLEQGQPIAFAVPTSSGRPHDIYRCSECGTALWSDYGRRAGLRFVRVGTLAESARATPNVHIYTRSKLPWVHLPSGQPAFASYYDVESLWPAPALERRRAALGSSQ